MVGMMGCVAVLAGIVCAIYVGGVFSFEEMGPLPRRRLFNWYDYYVTAMPNQGLEQV
jgi:hypothetical protein